MKAYKITFKFRRETFTWVRYAHSIDEARAQAADKLVEEYYDKAYILAVEEAVNA